MTARSVPVMPNFFAGQKLTGTLLNQVGTYGTFWASKPMFRMHQGTTQPVPNSAWTQITCDTLDYDTDSGRNIATPWSFVIPIGMTGRWSFGWSIPWVSNTTGSRGANLYRNGNAASTYPFIPAASGSGVTSGWVDRIACNAGDVMALYGFQSSGGSLATFIAADAMPTFWGSFESLATP